MTARQTIGLLLLVTFLPSCTTWSRYDGEGPPIGQERVRVHFQGGEHIRVAPGGTLETGEASLEDADDVALWSPFTVHDYYAGIVNPKSPGEELRYIPMSSIDRFDIRTFNLPKTVVGVAVVTAISLAIVFALTYEAPSDPSPGTGTSWF